MLRGLAGVIGYDATRIATVALGIGGIVGFFVLRKVAGNIDGCLVRMLTKLVGWLVYAAGIGLLILSLFLGDQFKACLGVEDKPAADATPAAEAAPAT